MNKVEGATDKCHCGATVKCVKISFKGEDKLQWQNLDGTAHYSPPGEDGKFPPCPDKIEDPKNQRIDTGGSGQPAGEVQPSTSATTSSSLPQPKAGDYIIKDFFAIYRTGYLEAEKFVKETIYFGKNPTEAEVRIAAQCIMKSLIHYFLENSK